MSCFSPSCRTPSWLRRHPHLLARWLAANNAMHRFTQDRRRAATIISAASIAAFALLYATASAGAVELIEPLRPYWPLVALLAALHAAMTVTRRLGRLEAARSSSWLAAAPVQFSSLRFTERLVSMAPVFLQWFAMSVLIAMLAGAEAASVRSALALIAALSAGAAGGLVLGLWMPQSQSKARPSYEPSRYARAARVADVQSLRPSNTALSRWPVNLALSWGRPENARVLLLIALCAVQGGTSILGGLTVIAMWVAAAYLGSLLAATMQVAREASVWLRSTPVKFHAFAWPIARRALLHQVLGTVGAAGVMMALGASPSMVSYLSALWLAVVVLVCAVSVAECYRARSPALKLMLSLCAMAAIEIRQHAWSIPLAVLLAAWHLRAGAKS